MTRWPELVIFDCDGVLVDSEVLALTRTGAALSRHGLFLSDAQLRDRFLGLSAPSMREIAERELGRRLPPEFADELARDVLSDFERELEGVRGVEDAVRRLDARVCVASSSSVERIHASLRIVDYARLFGPNVFSSSEVERGKPEPDLFLHAARQMDAAPGACVVVEDSVAGITAAVRAGMLAFGFAGGAHAGGPEYRARLQVAGAALVFETMGELPDIIEAWRANGGQRPSNGS